MPLPSNLRHAIGKLPLLRRVVAQRNGLRAALDASEADRARLHAELLVALTSRSELVSERDRLLADLAALRHAADESLRHDVEQARRHAVDESRRALEATQADLARTHAQRIEALASRDLLLAERDRLLGELRTARSGWEQSSAALASVQAERARLHAELLEISAARDALLSERDRLLVDLDSLRRGWERYGSEREALLEQLRATRKGWDELRVELSALRRSFGAAPPGHVYSPIPALDAIRRDEARIFASVPRRIPGIDLHEREQLGLLDRLVACYRQMPFGASPQPGLRFHFENPASPYSDAILSHCMIRHLRPQKIVGIGAASSASMILDTNELFFGGSIATTFIEPYPQLLDQRIREADRESAGGRVRAIASRLQDVDLGEFESLQANDVLFIDSSHVTKIDSDVNRIIFEILPRLASGVHVRFHNVLYPFEYPKAWVYEGRAWNEAYLLRGFLQYNDAFRVVLMNTYLQHFHRAFFEQYLPLCLRNDGGSLWIRRQ